MLEILAPCGSKESFISAVNNGADALYLGLADFSARKNAENFTAENISYYVAYAHTFGIKVYVCVNTVIKTSELKDFYNTVKTAYHAGADAFIVQDIWLGKRLKKAFGDICLHLSTQAGINNVYGARLAKEFGFSRVVLARETDINEIAEISKIIETEVFVHGALCTSLSGHCYMSSFIGGNSGNRGLCRQPCRQKYTYSFNNKTCYALSLSDLCLVDKISQLKDAGVSSLKIEGRMRSPEYVGSAIRLYKRALLSADYEKEFNEVSRHYNRGGYTKGYVFGEDKNLLSTSVQGHLGTFVQKITKFSNGKIVLDKKVFKDSGFKILRNYTEVGSAKALEDGKLIAYSGDIKIGDLLYITKDTSKMEADMPKRKMPIKIEAGFFTGEKAWLKSMGVTVYSQNVLEKAKSISIDYSTVLENLSRTDIYPFEVENLDFSGDACFITKAELNWLRKSLYEQIFYKKKARQVDNEEEFFATKNVIKNSKNLAVISSSYYPKLNGKITDFIFAPKSYENSEIDAFLTQVADCSFEKYLYIPAFLTEKEIAKVSYLACGFDGLYVEGSFGIELAKDFGKKVFLGIEQNITSLIDVDEILSLGVHKYCVSKELNIEESKGLSGYVLALGSIKVMSLIYCPNNRNCSDCNVGDMCTLTDFGNRVFPVRRYKTSTCRFEIFNEKIIASKKPFDSMIFDFSGLDCATANQLIDEYFNNGFEGVRKKYPYTTGNLVKGIN